MRLSILLKGMRRAGLQKLRGKSAPAAKNFNITATSGLSRIALDALTEELARGMLCVSF